MAMFKRFFRIWQLKNCASSIAKKLGNQEQDGWTYDDGKMRIVTDSISTIVYYPNSLGERKMVFLRSKEPPHTTYYPGIWEKYFANRYNSMRARLF